MNGRLSSERLLSPSRYREAFLVETTRAGQVAAHAYPLREMVNGLADAFLIAEPTPHLESAFAPRTHGLEVRVREADARQADRRLRDAEVVPELLRQCVRLAMAWARGRRITLEEGERAGSDEPAGSSHARARTGLQQYLKLGATLSEPPRSHPLGALRGSLLEPGLGVHRAIVLLTPSEGVPTLLANTRS